MVPLGLKVRGGQRPRDRGKTRLVVASSQGSFGGSLDRTARAAGEGQGIWSGTRGTAHSCRRVDVAQCCAEGCGSLSASRGSRSEGCPRHVAEGFAAALVKAHIGLGARSFGWHWSRGPDGCSRAALGFVVDRGQKKCSHRCRISSRSASAWARLATRARPVGGESVLAWPSFPDHASRASGLPRIDVTLGRIACPAAHDQHINAAFVESVVCPSHRHAGGPALLPANADIQESPFPALPALERPSARWGSSVVA